MFWYSCSSYTVDKESADYNSVQIFGENGNCCLCIKFIFSSSLGKLFPLLFPATILHLYILRVLKRSGIPPEDLINIFYALVRSVLEYACVTWSTSLPIYLKDKIESPQKSSAYSIPGAELQRCHCGCKLHSLKGEKRRTL